MENIRPRNLPSIGGISNFHEINIRTYVNYDGKPGVYFLSIEAGSKLFCWIARKLSKLPYRFTQMERSPTTIKNRNITTEDKLNLEYKVGHRINTKTESDLWLTERYALFQETNQGMKTYDIHHIEWPLSNIELSNCEIHYPKFSNLINSEPLKTHCSHGVKVLAWK